MGVVNKMGGGIENKSILKTPWDFATDAINDAVQKEEGSLICEMGGQILGINIQEYPIKFQRTSNNGFTPIKITKHLPRGIEIYKDCLLQEVRSKIADYVADNLGELLKNYREINK